MGAFKSYSVSFGRSPSKKQPTFTDDELRKNREKIGGFMKTGLSKKQKTTNIYFNEADSIIEVCTYNTALKKRLTEFAGKYPSECRLIDDDGNGCLTFEVSKGRFGFKLTAPYDETRRKAASELAKKNTERLRRQEQ